MSAKNIGSDGVSPDSVASTDILTAISNSTEKSTSSLPPGEAYKTRKSGQSVTHLNPALGSRGPFEKSSSPPLGTRCQLTTNDEDFENITQRYRYMFTTLDERARAIDRHMMRLQQQLCEMIKISEEDLTPVGIPKQEDVWVCGRICCEYSTTTLSASNIYLEGSRRDGGRKVHLDVKEISSYSLFPGQVVLVEGINATGTKMVAKRIIHGIARPLAMSQPQKLLEYHHSEAFQGSSPISMMVASGPFTTSDSLDYAPLVDLLQRVLTERPDVLILTGPFVDIAHPKISSGDITLKEFDDNGDVVGEHSASYEMVFIEMIIRDGLQSLFNTDEFLPTNIILVPSLNDAHHEFVYPQPPFGDRDRLDTPFFDEALGVLNVPFSKDSDVRKRVHLMPNPCVFGINEVVVGVTSNDVLANMSMSEINFQAEGNRLARLAGHLLLQQSFSPQFPSPDKTSLQLDYRQSRHWQLKVTPDILIIPSKLACLCKDVMDNTLVINPGKLTKGVHGGTFAEVVVHPLPESALRAAHIEGKEALPHAVPPRTYVNILKI